MKGHFKTTSFSDFSKLFSVVLVGGLLFPSPSFAKPGDQTPVNPADLQLKAQNQIDRNELSLEQSKQRRQIQAEMAARQKAFEEERRNHSLQVAKAQAAARDGYLKVEPAMTEAIEKLGEESRPKFMSERIYNHRAKEWGERGNGIKADKTVDVSLDSSSINAQLSYLLDYQRLIKGLGQASKEKSLDFSSEETTSGSDDSVVKVMADIRSVAAQHKFDKAGQEEAVSIAQAHIDEFSNEAKGMLASSEQSNKNRDSLRTLLIGRGHPINEVSEGEDESAKDSEIIELYGQTLGMDELIDNIKGVMGVLRLGLQNLDAVRSQSEAARDLAGNAPTPPDNSDLEEALNDPALSDNGGGSGGGNESPSDSGAGGGEGGGGGGEGGGNKGGGRGLQAPKIAGPTPPSQSPDFSGLAKPDTDISSVAQAANLAPEQIALAPFNSPVTGVNGVGRITPKNVGNSKTQRFSSGRTALPPISGDKSAGGGINNGNGFFGGVTSPGGLTQSGGSGGGTGGGSFEGSPFNGVGNNPQGRPPKLDAVRTVNYGSGGGANDGGGSDSTIALGSVSGFSASQSQIVGARRSLREGKDEAKGLMARVGNMLSDVCDDSKQRGIANVCGNTYSIEQKDIARRGTQPANRAIASIPEPKFSEAITQ